MPIRPLIAGLVAGLVIAVVRYSARMFAWGWRSRAAAERWAETRPESYLAPRVDRWR